MKGKRVFIKASAAFLTAMMLMGGGPADSLMPSGVVTAFAAENPRLSKTRVNIRNKKTKKIKVKGTKKKISVSSSDKTIAKVSRSGKTAFKVKAAKKKKGIAVIRVKTSKGYRYVLVKVGKGKYMSARTRKWAIAGGFIKAGASSAKRGNGNSGNSAERIYYVSGGASSSAGASGSSGTSGGNTANGSGGWNTSVPSWITLNAQNPNSAKYDQKAGHDLAYYAAMEADGVYLSPEQGREQTALEIAQWEQENVLPYTLDDLPMLESLYEQGNGWSLMTEHQMDELIRLRKEKEELDNKPFHDLLEQYVPYCKDYIFQILKDNGYGTKSELEVLKGYQDFMSRSFYYFSGGHECPDFFYPELWKAETEQGYVKSKRLGLGYTCGGSAAAISSVAVNYYGSQTRIISMPEFSAGAKSHVATAILLPDGWYVFSPGYKYKSGGYNPGHVTGPYTSSSTGHDLEIYNRIMAQDSKDSTNVVWYPYGTY